MIPNLSKNHLIIFPPEESKLLLKQKEHYVYNVLSFSSLYNVSLIKFISSLYGSL